MSKIPTVDGPRLRIALSIWMFKPGTGGLQAHAENLARHLILRGHEVTVITRAYTRVPEFMDFLYFREPVGKAVVGGVPVQTLDYAAALRPLHWIIAKCKDRRFGRKLALRLYRWQAQFGNARLYEGFDIIHHVGQASAFVGFAAADAARRHGVPFVVQPTCHPFQVGDDALDLLLHRGAARALVHTAYEADHMRPHLAGIPIVVVGNGIEDRADGNGSRFRATFQITGPLVLYIGRRDSDKGYDLAVEAFLRLRRHCGDVTLVCMGPAGQLPKVEAPGIIHLDYADEQTKHDALAACTCLCVPSEGESFGLVYMEAGRYGKPVVARRLPVLEELLDGGRAGLLVGTLNRARNANTLTADELAVALQELLDDPATCARLGAACRGVSDAFIWPRVVERFEQAYYDTCRLHHHSSGLTAP